MDAWVPNWLESKVSGGHMDDNVGHKIMTFSGAPPKAMGKPLWGEKASFCCCAIWL